MTQNTSNYCKQFSTQPHVQGLNVMVPCLLVSLNKEIKNAVL